ncbi:MAG: zf-HC2 domain-containing protein [Gemmatimonadetes bacterium]|nr:zf-HC2 domain-containing protein [Gemmatimonadota bacterium]
MTTLMTCTQADAQLAAWLDGTLDARATQAIAAHVRGCSRCADQLAALDAPLPAAAALPELVPSRDLWQGIAERIAAPVVPLAPRPASAIVTPRRFGWVAQAAAAVALVTVTAGTTWMYAAHAIGRVADAQVGRLGELAVSQAARAGQVRGTGDRVRAVSADNSLAAVEQTYDAQVGALREILQQRRAELDPRTLAVLEKNLKLIDDAIAQSRAAIARDPANLGLGDQLATTLDKKLQLLRTAALLPPRA